MTDPIPVPRELIESFKLDIYILANPCSLHLDELQMAAYNRMDGILDRLLAIGAAPEAKSFLAGFEPMHKFDEYGLCHCQQCSKLRKGDPTMSEDPK